MSFKLKRDPTEKKDILIKYKGSDAEVVIPNGVYKIGIGAFRANCNIRRVVIPHGLKFIEEQAFRRCKSLETVELPQGLIKVGFLAFQHCEKLENIRLPGSIQTIEASAFETCSALKQIKLPDNLSAIESAALGKTGLVKCVIPGRIRVIRSYLMHDCPELTCVTIMDGVEKIEGGAFQDCPKLADIEIPPSVIEIHEEAFNSGFSKKLNTTVRIHGAPGSAAEIFAKAHGFPFVDAPVPAEKTPEEKCTFIAGVSDGQAKIKPAPLPAAARPETLPATADRFGQRVAELKERYAGKPVPATLQQFRAENRDMDFAAFSAWVREARGSTPAKYLTEQGLMARAQTVPPPETGKKAALAQSDPDFVALCAKWDALYDASRKPDEQTRKRLIEIVRALAAHPATVDCSGKHFIMEVFEDLEQDCALAVRIIKLGGVLRNHIREYISYVVLADRYPYFEWVDQVIRLRKKGSGVALIFQSELAGLLKNQSTQPFRDKAVLLRQTRTVNAASIEVKGKSFIFACKQHTEAVEIEIEKQGGRVLNPYMKSYETADYVVIPSAGEDDLITVKALQYAQMYPFRLLNISNLRKKLSDDPGYKLAGKWDELSNREEPVNRTSRGKPVPRYMTKPDYLREIAYQPQELDIAGKKFHWNWNLRTYEWDRKYPALLTMLGGIQLEYSKYDIQNSDYFICDLDQIDHSTSVAIHVRQMYGTPRIILAQWLKPYLEQIDTLNIRAELSADVSWFSIKPEEMLFEDIQYYYAGRYKNADDAIAERIRAVGGSLYRGPGGKIDDEGRARTVFRRARAGKMRLCDYGFFRRVSHGGRGLLRAKSAERRVPLCALRRAHKNHPEKRAVFRKPSESGPNRPIASPGAAEIGRTGVPSGDPFALMQENRGMYEEYKREYCAAFIEKASVENQNAIKRERFAKILRNSEDNYRYYIHSVGSRYLRPIIEEDGRIDIDPEEAKQLLQKPEFIALFPAHEQDLVRENRDYIKYYSDRLWLGFGSVEFIMHFIAALKAFAESDVSADIGFYSDKWEYRGDYGRKEQLAIRADADSDRVEFYYREQKPWNNM